MARPITPGDHVPTNPPLKVLAVEERDNGQLLVTVTLPDGHPLKDALVADALHGTSVAITGLIGHPGTGADEDEDPRP